MEGDSLTIFVRPNDISKVVRINNFTFAGSILRIESMSLNNGPPGANVESETPKTVEVLKDLLSRRSRALVCSIQPQESLNFFLP